VTRRLRTGNTRMPLTTSLPIDCWALLIMTVPSDALIVDWPVGEDQIDVRAGGDREVAGEAVGDLHLRARGCAGHASERAGDVRRDRAAGIAGHYMSAAVADGRVSPYT